MAGRGLRRLRGAATATHIAEREVEESLALV